MLINFSYDKNFEELIAGLRAKYPDGLSEINGISDDDLDITAYSKKYFLKRNTADSTVDKNANVQAHHIAVYHSERFKSHSKLNSMFLLWKMLAKLYGHEHADRMIELEYNKTINIQDSFFTYQPYCFNFATYDLLTMGLPFIENLPSDPPKHGDSFLQQVVQLCMFASNQLLGATGIGDVLIVYSHLVKHDSMNKNYPVPDYRTDEKLFDKYLRQEFQKFIYTLNQPVRFSQSLFSNITIFDTIFLSELKKLYVMPDGKGLDTEFAMMIQKKFIKFFIEFSEKQLFTFPIITVQFKTNEANEIEDQEFFHFVMEKNMSFASFNIFSTQNLTALSSCCRLQSNVEDILKASTEENTNLIGGSTLKVGSLGVCTINLPRIALRVDGKKEEFIDQLKDNTKFCIQVNNARRELIKSEIDKGQLPLYNYGFIRLSNQYSTVGINGFYEAVEIMGLDILSPEGQEFGVQILNTIQDVVKSKIKLLGYKINIEQIPAEATGAKLARADKILYKQNKYHLYSNQFLPLVNETDIVNRIHLQSLFENYFDGGSILHLNVNQKIESLTVMKRLAEYTIKTGVKYFAVNYFFQKCEDGHITIDDSEVCAICGKTIVEHYTRVVGFTVPVSSWAQDRREEFKMRKKYGNGNFNFLKKTADAVRQQMQTVAPSGSAVACSLYVAAPAEGGGGCASYSNGNGRGCSAYGVEDRMVAVNTIGAGQIVCE